MNNAALARADRAAGYRALIAVFGAMLYGISPLDLIPDVIPLIGWIDDAILVPALLVYAFVQFRRSKRRTA